jgi:C4-dicarboxylate transporter DctM subunit
MNLRRLERVEDVAMSLALGAMMLVPLAEALLRKTLNTGIANSTSIVQHLTLYVAMMGGALAARSNRLLSLSTLGQGLKGRWLAAGNIFNSACSAAIGGLFCAAGIQFVVSERAGGKIFAYGIPLWTIEALIPVGMCLIAVRLIGYASATWPGRMAAVALAAAMITACVVLPGANHLFGGYALTLLGVAAILGAPAFVVLGGAALLLFWRAGDPMASAPIDLYSLTVNPFLPTMPLFTLAGFFLAEGGAARRLIRVFRALMGGARGGPAIVTACVCAFFTSFTGGSGVTILALGGLLMPILIAEKYSERDALGLVTSAGSLGLLFAPCLPLILYAIVAKVTMKTMFLAGLGPGLLLLAATAGWGIWRGRTSAKPAGVFSLSEARSAVWDAKWELLLPFVTMGALFGGFATTVEASAITAAYALVVEVFVYRDLDLKRGVPKVMAETGLLVGSVLLILGVAQAFTNYLVVSQISSRAVEWTETSIHSRWAFLLLLNLFLLIVGCLMDIYVAIVVQAPLLVPIAAAFGVNPAHLGIIFLANLELGYLSPPVGINLFLSAGRFNKSVPEVLRAVFPMTLVLATGVLLITYVPALTLALPQWLDQ